LLKGQQRSSTDDFDNTRQPATHQNKKEKKKRTKENLSSKREREKDRDRDKRCAGVKGGGIIACRHALPIFSVWEGTRKKEKEPCKAGYATGLDEKEAG